MKVGPHSNMSLKEIIKSKQEEELLHQVHYWGYSGVFCQPKPTKEFCKKCVRDKGEVPLLVLLETKSHYKSSIGTIKIIHQMVLIIANLKVQFSSKVLNFHLLRKIFELSKIFL